ncbi:alpha/beta hydrolase fold domain-containing protein [Actinophytocola sp.]|uniref:alpha/beta hydrolase fold domain-containing protein n=1 Tax=Actinophytocola sp. TaxID=1872138 RepID=UPI00389A97D6
MPLHQYFVDWLTEMTSAGDSEQAIRQRMTQRARERDPWAHPDVVVADAVATGPHGPIPLRTYRPRHGECARSLLWVHGGGFRNGDLDMPEAHVVSGELSLRTTAFVVSVGYRLARDGVRYPVPLDDVHAAWSWLRSEHASLPAALGGASAGAALALATALRARDRAEATPAALLLAYPFAHFPVPALDDATAVEMAGTPAFARSSPAAVEEMVVNYVGRISDLPADALPGGARLAELPPTRLVLSEYDDLRPSGELLERQLREVDVPVTSHVARGMRHGHLNHVAPLAGIEESIAFLADGLSALS